MRGPGRFGSACRITAVAAAALLPAAVGLRAQGVAPARTVIYGHAIPARGFIRIWNPAGSVRVTGWDADSVAVSAQVQTGADFGCGAAGAGVKCAIGGVVSDEAAAAPTRIEVQVPRQASVWVKTAGADVELADVGGDAEVYSVTGTIRFTGHARTVQLESMAGALDIDGSATSLRARSGEGAITLSGTVEDADVSSVSGSVDVRAAVQRGRVESIDGPVHWRAAPVPGSRIDLISHSGAIDVRLPAGTGATFAVSNYRGTVSCAAPAVTHGAAASRERSCTVAPTADARFTIRNFKGPVSIGR